MQKEQLDTAAIDFYRPGEFRALLQAAEGPMRAVIALQGLAGLRLEEALRLTWESVFRVPGHIEITGQNAKMRRRRLVEICPALAAGLEPFRSMEGLVWSQTATLNGYVSAFSRMREPLKIPSRRNGLRHAFCSFHFALHSNENLTAATAGNSPAMIHAHYKGLARKPRGRSGSMCSRPKRRTSSSLPPAKIDLANLRTGVYAGSNRRFTWPAAVRNRFSNATPDTFGQLCATRVNFLNPTY